ncbi:MAG: hypothetical protein WAN60_11090 [Candidatus Sulfotelmatobacter sp.]
MELFADADLAAVAGSECVPLGDVLESAAALQGAAFFALLCGLCFATAGFFFGAGDESEAGLLAGTGCWACGAV